MIITILNTCYKLFIKDMEKHITLVKKRNMCSTNIFRNGYQEYKLGNALNTQAHAAT